MRAGRAVRRRKALAPAAALGEVVVRVGDHLRRAIVHPTHAARFVVGQTDGVALADTSVLIPCNIRSDKMKPTTDPTNPQRMGSRPKLGAALTPR